MEQVDTITLELQVDGHRWRWRGVSGRTGTTTIELRGVRVGDQLVVGLRWQRAAWSVTRYIRFPEHTWLPAPAPPDAPLVTVDGRTPVPDARDASVLPGDVRLALAHMDPRSSARRDAGRTAKLRPAVVAWIDRDRGQAGIHFLYDLDSAVRREGLGRRLVGWREAGLRKPSVASAEQLVRDLGELGQLVGRLAPADRTALGIAGTAH